MTAAQIIAESGVYKIHYTPSVGGTYRLNLRLKKSTATPQTFYVDNVTITSKDAVSLSSKADYYPFGWKLPGRTQQGSQKYRYGYQGEFAEEDDETGWNQFELRMWDGRVGRWMTTDPYRQHFSPYLGMGNNSISRTDPDGGCDDPPCKEYEGGNIEAVTVTVETEKNWGAKFEFFNDGTWQYLPNEYEDAISRYDDAYSSWRKESYENYKSWEQTQQRTIDNQRFGKVMMNTPIYLIDATMLGASTGAGRGAVYLPKLVRGAAAKASGQGGLNLFKWGAPQTTKATGWKTGDYFLHLPNKGTPKLNWKANYGSLRREMGLGKPIFDSYRTTGGNLIPTKGFLGAERFILRSRGWIYSPSKGAWLPPGF